MSEDADQESAPRTPQRQEARRQDPRERTRPEKVMQNSIPASASVSSPFLTPSSLCQWYFASH